LDKTLQRVDRLFFDGDCGIPYNENSIKTVNLMILSYSASIHGFANFAKGAVVCAPFLRRHIGGVQMLPDLKVSS
jgi:hypothetical protein